MSMQINCRIKGSYILQIRYSMFGFANSLTKQLPRYGSPHHDDPHGIFRLPVPSPICVVCYVKCTRCRQCAAFTSSQNCFRLQSCSSANSSLLQGLIVRLVENVLWSQTSGSCMYCYVFVYGHRNTRNVLVFYEVNLKII